MLIMRYKYRRSILEALELHGIRPHDSTPPQLVYDYLKCLYTIEIRALRNRQWKGLIPLKGYADQVILLRNRYPVLSIPAQLWIEK